MRARDNGEALGQAVDHHIEKATPRCPPKCRPFKGRESFGTHHELRYGQDVPFSPSLSLDDLHALTAPIESRIEAEASRRNRPLYVDEVDILDEIAFLPVLGWKQTFDRIMVPMNPLTRRIDMYEDFPVSRVVYLGLPEHMQLRW